MKKQQTPWQQVAERAADAIPGLQAAASAIGLESHRAMLNDSRKRIADSHAIQMQAAGFNAPDSEEAMGDIIITGDISSKDPASVISGLKNDLPTQLPKKSNKLITLGLIAASLATGSTLPLLLNNFLDQPVIDSVAPGDKLDTVNQLQSTTTIENDYKMKIWRDNDNQ